MIIAGMVGFLCLTATLLLATDLTRASSAVPGEIDSLREQVKELEARVQALEGTVKELKARLRGAIILPDRAAGTSAPRLPRVPRAPMPPGEIWREGECNGWPFYLIPCGTGEAGTGP